MSTHPWIAEQLIAARGEELRRAATAHYRIDGPAALGDGPRRSAPSWSPARWARAASRHVGQALIRVGVRLAGPDQAAAFNPGSSGAAPPATFAGRPL